jgi:hypothetical protein
MLAKIIVSVASGGDVEVALHLVAFQTPVDPTRVGRAFDTRSLGELLLLGLAELVVHIPELLPAWVNPIVLA